jgi:hypothetical protein
MNRIGFDPADSLSKREMAVNEAGCMSCIARMNGDFVEKL